MVIFSQNPIQMHEENTNKIDCITTPLNFACANIKKFDLIFLAH